MIDLKENTRVIKKTESFSLESFKKWVNLWWDYLRKKRQKPQSSSIKNETGTKLKQISLRIL